MKVDKQMATAFPKSIIAKSCQFTTFIEDKIHADDAAGGCVIPSFAMEATAAEVATTARRFGPKGDFEGSALCSKRAMDIETN
mmetsp:Transcript_62716/g.185287  ORF Transcript_62716/g.185287 Transcript_62716/m.185287 type:complete len:83 (-) Transcript_62716:123-371(-)